MRFCWQSISETFTNNSAKSQQIRYSLYSSGKSLCTCSYLFFDAWVMFCSKKNPHRPHWHVISPDSSQCGPVSQVNSWKHLNIIHHSLVLPCLLLLCEKAEQMIDCQLPSMRHLHDPVENKKPGQVGTIPTATHDNFFGKGCRVWPLTHSTGPLKQRTTEICHHSQPGIYKAVLPAYTQPLSFPLSHYYIAATNHWIFSTVLCTSALHRAESLSNAHSNIMRLQLNVWSLMYSQPASTVTVQYSNPELFPMLLNTSDWVKGAHLPAIKSL